MEIQITFRHGQSNDSIQDTIRQKVSKLPRFYDRTTGIEVIVDLEHEDQPTVEVKVSVEEADDFFAADKGPNVIAALDSAVRKLEQQLRKHKGKVTGHRNRGAKQMDIPAPDIPRLD